MKNALFLVLLLCIALSALADKFNDAYQVVEYHHEDGLPNDLVKDLLMDNDGFIWVSTDDGLVKIEGRHFKQIAMPEMFSNNFKQMALTRHFGLLSTADPGLLILDDDVISDKLYFFEDYYNIDSWPELIYLKTIYEQADSSIWLADLSNIYRIKPEGHQVFHFDDKNSTDNFSRSFQFFEIGKHFFTISQTGYLYQLGENGFFEVQNYPFKGSEIYTLLKYDANNLLIGAEAGLFHLTINRSGHIEGAVKLPFSHPVASIVQLDDATFVVGTWAKGAYVFNLDSENSTSRFINETADRTINDIIIDRSGQLWMGTNAGIILLRNISFSTPYTHHTTEYIQDVQKGTDGRIYFSDGAKVYAVNNNKSIEAFYQFKNETVLKILPTSNGVWMSTNKGRLVFRSYINITKVYDYSTLGDEIHALTIDKNYNIWFLQSRKNKQVLIKQDSNGNTVDYTPEINTNEYPLNTINTSPQGNIYVGGSGTDSYLYFYNEVTDTLVFAGDVVSTVNDLPYRVYDIGFFSEEHLLMATSLGLYELKYGSIKQLQIGDMTNELVTALVIDKKQRIWFANSNGIIRFEDEELNIYDTRNGLPSKTTNYGCMLIDDKDELWVGTIAGVARGRVIYEPDKTPKPQIISMEDGGVPINFIEENKFIRNSFIHVTMATPCYPARYVKYKYSLSANGKDNWKPLFANEDELIISGLKPGNYKLKIKAKKQGHAEWSNPFIYPLKIYEVWYKRPIVLVGFYLSLFVLIFIYLGYARNKSQREKTKLESIIDERTQSMQEKNEELIQLNSELAIAKHKAEEAIKAKDRFFSILAHDLKSPFNTLIGFAELLVYNREDMSDESMNQFLQEMLKTSENTYKLIQNLLEWARSQTGTLKISREEFMVSELVDEVLKTLTPTAQQKNITIEKNISATITAYADIPMIATVLRNLLSNAIKYSFPGKKIFVTAESEGGKTKISVVDSGVGIQSGKIDKLFKIDSNISTKGTNDEKGTGLGLVLCKEFIEQNQGTISLKSTLGSGSTFTFSLQASKPGH